MYLSLMCKKTQACLVWGTRKLPFTMWLIAALTGLPAHAESCSGLLDDATLVACTDKELQDQVDSVRNVYEKLAEALGTRAAANLPDDQLLWLKRVSEHCGINAPGNLEAVSTSGLDIARKLCLKRFAEVRVSDLSNRLGRAKRDAAAYSSKNYPSVPSTLGDRLNPDGKAPLGRFKAYYLRSGNPASLVATETVEAVSINYPWDKFHGIKAEDFEGYWVGKFHYEKETPVQLMVDQSWSRTRVIVDRKLIYEGGNNASVPFVFSPGTHKVEVEYINNWHTTRLSVMFAEAMVPVGRSELRERLRSVVPENAVVQHVAVYESGSLDNTILVTLEPASVPVVLVLSSYSAVRWVVNNPEKANLRAIVYGSYAPGARIQMKGDAMDVPRLLLQGGLGSYDATPKCHCVGGLFHCEGGSLNSTVQTVSSLLGFPVVGVSGEYSPQVLAVPKVVVTPAVMADAKAALEQIGKERHECLKTQEFESH